MDIEICWYYLYRKEIYSNPDPTITSNEEAFVPNARGPIVDEVNERYKHIEKRSETSKSLFGDA